MIRVGVALLVFCVAMFGRVSVLMGQGMCGTSTMGSCSGTTYNVTSESFCCNGHIYPCSTPNDWECCGKMLMDKRTSLCCSNNVFANGPGMMCCDQTSFDTNSAVCCDGEVHPKAGPQTSCCGKKAYDARTYVCCETDIVLQADALDNLACRQDE